MDKETMIGIALEHTWASAAVLKEMKQGSEENQQTDSSGRIGTVGDIHPEKICDSDGSDLFLHENALRDYTSCVELLKKIRNRAQIFCGCAVDSAIISIPCDLNLKYWGLIKEAAKEAGFTRIRYMTRAMAEAIYIIGSRNLPLDEKSIYIVGSKTLPVEMECRFLIVMETDHGYEISAFELGDGICEALFVENQPEALGTEKFLFELSRKYVQYKEGLLQTEIYFCGKMTENIHGLLLRFFGENIEINRIKNECACGAAIYTSKLMGWNAAENLLALQGMPFSTHIKIDEDRTEMFFPKGEIIPTKGCVVIDGKPEVIKKGKLVICSESSAGNFSVAGEFDLRSFLKEENTDEKDRETFWEVTIVVDHNFDIKCFVAVFLKKNDEKIKEISFPLFNQDQNKILADLIKNSGRKIIADTKPAEKVMEDAVSREGSDRIVGKNAGKGWEKSPMPAETNNDGFTEIIRKLFPVIDDLEKSIRYAEQHSDSGVAEGLSMIEKKLFAILAEYGVKPIEAVGSEFCVDYHNAVSHVKNVCYKDNIVIEEVRKGYLYHGKVLRHSMVVVAN